jgi:putative endonuclease
MTFLVCRGWRIEAHRFRVGRHDLDIVARRASLVAFVEVKTRGTAGWGSPAESVGWRKQLILGRVAEVWRERHGRPSDWFRFDVIEVEVRATGGHRVTHLEDAWRLARRSP